VEDGAKIKIKVRGSRQECPLHIHVTKVMQSRNFW
jgi:hypothetical protein